MIILSFIVLEDCFQIYNVSRSMYYKWIDNGSTYVVGMFLMFTLYCIFLCWTLKCSNLSAFFFLISLYKAKAKYSKYSTSKSTIKTRDPMLHS